MGNVLSVADWSESLQRLISSNLNQWIRVLQICKCQLCQVPINLKVKLESYNSKSCSGGTPDCHCVLQALWSLQHCSICFRCSEEEIRVLTAAGRVSLLARAVLDWGPSGRHLRHLMVARPGAEHRASPADVTRTPWRGQGTLPCLRCQLR